MNVRKIFILLNILLAGLIVWLGADTFLAWQKSRSGSEAYLQQEKPHATKPKRLSNQIKQFKDFNKVIDKNIFKTSSAKEEKKDEKKPEKEIEITKLELKLKGTVLGDGNRAYAVIEDLRNRKEELYYLDDVVQGAQIVDILPDRVVLSVEGRKEILPLSMKSEGAYRRRSFTRRRPRTKRPPIKRYTYPRKVRSKKESK